MVCTRVFPRLSLPHLPLQLSALGLVALVSCGSFGVKYALDARASAAVAAQVAQELADGARRIPVIAIADVQEVALANVVAGDSMRVRARVGGRECV